MVGEDLSAFSAHYLGGMLWQGRKIAATSPRKKRKRSGDVLASAKDAEAAVERAEFKVVIHDFSAGAVDMFLRFLFTGSVQGSASALLEVAALADKYQVKPLHDLCMRLVREALTAVTACEVFASTDRFHMDDLRAEADAIKEILRSWRVKGGECLESKINIQTESLQTTNVQGELYYRYQWAGSKGAFVGGWVVVILGLEQREAYTTAVLENMASNSLRYNGKNFVAPPPPLSAKGGCSGCFPMPRFIFRASTWSCIPRGIYRPRHPSDDLYENYVPSSASFRIWTSEDGATWHLAYESKKEIQLGSFLPCKRPPGLVKCFKLEVLEGEL
ncbi:bath-42, partial [Symbiodinium sp. CCMP2456]